MRIAITSLALALMMSPAMAQQDDGPKDEKAQKTYKNALEELHNRRPGVASRRLISKTAGIASPARSR